LGIILTLADELIYSARSFALELCAPSTLLDQQVGGLVMWVLGGLIMFAAFSIVFFRWFGAPEAVDS
jgi:putative membrane protein